LLKNKTKTKQQANKQTKTLNTFTDNLGFAEINMLLDQAH